MHIEPIPRDISGQNGDSTVEWIKQQRARTKWGVDRTADSCVAYVRMGPHAFLNLAQMMRDNHSLKDSRHVTVEEQLAYFLHVVGHGERNRVVRTFFYRSTRTVSVYLRCVLRAINTMKDLFIKPPSTSIHPKIASNRNWYPYFKVFLIHAIYPLPLKRLVESYNNISVVVELCRLNR